jgi:hydrogenase maturation protease
MDYFENTSRETPSVLIIGIGNEYRSDDGVGISIVRELANFNMPHVAILEMLGEGSSLMEAWKNYDSVIIFDAVYSGEEAGKTFKFFVHEEKIPQRFFNYSTHSFSLAEAVELSRILGELPNQMIIYGIEGQIFSEGNNLSTIVKQSADDVIKEVSEAIIENTMSKKLRRVI